MGRTAATKDSVQERLDRTFPSRGLKVVEFSTMTKQGVIECPIHGLQVVNYFAHIFRSPFGCPECGKELRVNKAATRIRSGLAASDVLQSLKSLSPDLSDAEFRKAVLELLEG